MHPVTDPTEVDRLSLVREYRMTSPGQLLRYKIYFSGLITGLVLITVLNEPALANKTYSRAKTCYQNQYVETYNPGTREKPGYVSSREERVE